MVVAAGTALARIAASSDPLPLRASGLLAALRSAVPFDAAWLASADPHGGAYTTLASLDLDDDIAGYFSGPAMALEIAIAGTDRDLPPVSASDLSSRSQRRAMWSDCLSPAGIRSSLSVGLFARGGRHVGFVTLLSKTLSTSPRTARRRLAELAPVLALGVDPTPSLRAAARVVRGVTAGTVLRQDGSTESLPGLEGADPLLAVGSPVLAMACRRLGDGLLYSTFLWPLGGTFAPGRHARITVLAAPSDVPAMVIGMVLISPTEELHGLTPRELEVLGLVVDGCSNQEIADTLIVAPRTVAAHIEHLLIKLDVSTRTTAAVRAEREGLYVPSLPGSPHGVHPCGERVD